MLDRNTTYCLFLAAEQLLKFKYLRKFIVPHEKQNRL